MKKLLTLIILLFSNDSLFAQAADLVLDSFNNQTAIRAASSITLKNGFHIPSGNNVILSIGGYPNITSVPSSGENYILKSILRIPVKSGELAHLRTIAEENQTIQYFDGLGRPMQTVELMYSPNGWKDVVRHIEYDGFGRESRKYLPYAHAEGNGSYKTGGSASVITFYTKTSGSDIEGIVRTPKPYAETVFENSPLNRVQQQGAPGTAWQPAANRNTVTATSSDGHTVAMDYGTNSADDVLLWKVNDTGGGATAQKGMNKDYYLAGRLHKTVIRDENWTGGNAGTVEEYKDFDGQMVLKRVWNINPQTSQEYALNTYYVYDDFGDLRYVIPPGYTAATVTDSGTDFNELLYAYKYDSMRRLIEKKIPGKGWEYIVYNANDQPVLTQDSIQRGTGKWSYNKYDAFGRLASTGIYTNTALTTQLLAQNAVNSHPLVNGVRPLWEDRIGTADYTNKAFPTSGTVPYVINYYDDYTFAGASALPATGITKSEKTKALLTGTKISKDDGTAALLSVNYYDDRARLIQTAGQNHLGGIDIVTNTYSFVGELLTSKQEHRATPTGMATTVLTTNTYDHVGRLLTIRHKVNSQAEVILSKNEYNEIGQLKNKRLHSENSGNAFLSTVGYSYNERGWATKASSPQFTYQLNYHSGPAPQYNGNIAQQLWGHSATTVDTFSYDYDKINRLVKGSSTGVVMYERMEYNAMGNITKLVRNRQTLADTLAINYNYTVGGVQGNRLQSLSGGFTGSYTYDGNGNATKDRTGMAFTYNHLNLPKTANKTASGNNPAVSVQYLYDALGTKLRKTATENGITTVIDYVGGIEYTKVESAAAAITRIATPEGYLTRSGSSYIYHYNLTDHLGNVRSVLKKGTSATVPEIVQKSDYYPFGKRHGNSSYVYNENRYLYNGKELQDELRGGVHSFGSFYVQQGHYDYGARFYDPEIGRWNVADPMSEMFFSHSPYSYSFNNPVNFEDFDGMAPEQGGNTDPIKLYGKTVNMDNAPAGSRVNAAGHARNGPWFWRQMLSQHPEMFSDENKIKIRKGHPAPTIDDQWIKYNPTHAEYKHGKLVHHHVDQGNMATGIPEKAHQKYFKDLHTNRGGRVKGGLGKIGNVLGAFSLAFDLFSDDPHALGMQFSAGSDLNKLYYDSDSKQYFEVTARSDIKDGKGKVIGTKVIYTTFEDYRYNKTTRKKEGVNKIDTYEAVKYKGEAARHYLQKMF